MLTLWHGEYVQMSFVIKLNCQDGTTDCYHEGPTDIVASWRLGTT